MKTAGLGLGGAPVGNLYTEVDEQTALATVRTAVELGFSHLDTAPHYGAGLSEERIGRALAGLERRGTQVSTKVGRLLEPDPDYRPGDVDPCGFAVPARRRRRWDYSPAGLRRSLEESLERLGLDRVEILYLHDPDVHGLDEGMRTALPELARIRQEGLVDRIGVGSTDAEALYRCVEEADVDLVMCAGRYSLLEQVAAERLLPLCLERGVEVVAAGVYNSGALATDTLPVDVRYDYRPASAAVVQRLEGLHRLCSEHGVPLPAVAVQFVARHPAVGTVVLGARTPEEVREADERMRRPVPEELWAALEASGLLEHPR